MSWVGKFLLKYKFYIVLLLIIGGLFTYNKILRSTITNTETALKISSNNEKAYAYNMKKWEDRYGQEHAKTIMFNENLTSFKESQDSITKELASIIKQQGYSLDKLRMASLIETKIQTSLTKEIQTKLPDTVVDLSNKDIKNIVTLSPYRITSDIELFNKQTILARDSAYKIFIPYRKSFFLSRWLQRKKKETLVTVEVFNSNPLITTDKQKFIHIIK